MISPLQAWSSRSDLMPFREACTLRVEICAAGTMPVCACLSANPSTSGIASPWHKTSVPTGSWCHTQLTCTSPHTSPNSEVIPAPMTSSQFAWHYKDLGRLSKSSHTCALLQRTCTGHLPFESLDAILMKVVTIVHYCVELHDEAWQHHEICQICSSSSWPSCSLLSWMTVFKTCGGRMVYLLVSIEGIVLVRSCSMTLNYTKQCVGASDAFAALFPRIHSWHFRC